MNDCVKNKQEKWGDAKIQRCKDAKMKLSKEKTGKVGFEPTVSDKVHVSFQD